MSGTDEFSLIEIFAEHFRAPVADVWLGIGDDAAVTSLPSGRDLVTATDALIEGTHFLPETDPRSVGHRSLAINLSDIAAMGAEPHWATLSLSLPSGDRDWVTRFAAGFAALAKEFGVTLIGGDTVRGPLGASVTLLGSVPSGAAVTRSAAQSGDRLFVTGVPGHAGAGCRIRMGALSADDPDDYLACFEYPQPQVRLAVELRELVTAMIDVSDGVAPDLARLLAASSKGAVCVIPGLGRLEDDFGTDEAVSLFLSGGEDYELCLTVAPDNVEQVQSLAAAHRIPLHELGVVHDEAGISWSHDGVVLPTPAEAFSHFGAGDE
ncbi:MAG: thiamine-phosphate kinase [Gammaproteobacteria bacterium]|nr:thiamine-phosphate kinase [Gammaproteobacteria bacterium]NND53649.1 thiamine-phosphate kinase [Gammaproteobacteria bacterium]